MGVVTRFAPSPTGFLHIGGARTALFNWLYARNQGGKFLLRIEDTDRARSTKEAVDAIIDGMKWLGLDWDGDVYHQFSMIELHKKVVKQLLDEGKAYHCYCSKEELEAMRAKAMAEKAPLKYDGTWRDRDPSDAPEGVKPVVRLKAPLTGQTIIEDQVQGRVVVENEQLDDLILLRADGTPTYMLAVVVDDHDMAVTHIIRGDDHLTNSFRQKILYDAMGWKAPVFAHIPLIHGADGAKLSKRHGALGVDAYRDMGYLPEAMRNHLLRLGWSHGDEEIISQENAIKWFDLEHIGKSPSRFDFTKLDSVNAYYIKECDNKRLADLIVGRLAEKTGGKISKDQKDVLVKGMDGLKQRAKTLNELAESALFYIKRPDEITPKAQKALDAGQEFLDNLIEVLKSYDGVWDSENLERVLKEFSEKNDIGLGKVMGPIRSAITGSHASPSMFEAMDALGKDEVIARLGSV